MKVCKICKLEYSDTTEVCAKCGSKLEKEEVTWTSPSDYEEGY